MARHGTTTDGRFQRRPRLTIRLPCTHHRLNGSRETCHTPREPGTSARSASCIRSLTLHRALRLGLAAHRTRDGVDGVGSKPAHGEGEESCADQVIADWYDDGRVGKIYPLHCYREAIAKLPPDVLDYSNAKEEIGRALAFAKQGKPDPGGSDPSPGSTATTATTTHDRHDDEHDHDDDDRRRRPRRRRRRRRRPTRPRRSRRRRTPPGPSSVPVPLLVLGGLAVLLLAAGSAGYLRRRMNGGDDGDGTPPAAARRVTAAAR